MEALDSEFMPSEFRNAPQCPLVRDSTLAPWLLGSDSGRCSLFNQAVEPDRVERNLDGLCYAANGKYQDATSHALTYSRLVSLAAKEEEALSQ
eukprot:2436072-Prymnesium_polylepis.1